jgi:hypothetical protein
VEEGKARGSMTLKGFEKRVGVGGREHLVRVIDGDAELEESQGGKKLLRINGRGRRRKERLHDYLQQWENQRGWGTSLCQRLGTWGQRGRRRCDRGIDRSKAEGAPHEEWQDNDRMRQGASSRFHALRRAGGHHSEMARRDGPMNKTT